MEGDANSDTAEKLRLNRHIVELADEKLVSLAQAYSVSALRIPDDVRMIPHPACLPLYDWGFQCRRSMKIVPNEFLSKKHSNLIRITFLNILALIDYSRNREFYGKFAALEASIKMCVCVGEKWCHVSLSLFRSLEALYANQSSLKPHRLKKGITKVVNDFVSDLQCANDVDGLEMQLLSMREHTGIDVDRIFRIVEKLRRHNCDFVAVHYLYSFAYQVEDLHDVRRLLGKAQQLDIYPYHAAKVMKTISAERSIKLNAD
jgi:hypothetical protein